MILVLTSISLKVLPLNELVFVGLGLNDEQGITLKGLGGNQERRHRFHGNLHQSHAGFFAAKFENSCGKKSGLIGRNDLEEETAKSSLKLAKRQNCVSGSRRPFIATTHVTLASTLKNRE
jgi:diphthamide biosynthesis methyltransferase